MSCCEGRREGGGGGRRIVATGAMAVAIVAGLAGAGRAAALTPNDPYYIYQWYAPKIGLPQAWDWSTGSPSVKVAVLDTGVIPWVPDLVGRVLPNQTAVGGAPPSGEIFRHGTWVASTLAMGVNNGEGGAGVGNFTILPIAVTSGQTNSVEWVANGIRMAADQGAKVINLSQSPGAFGYALWDEAAAYAREKGALTFVAAGNSFVRDPTTGFDNLIFVSGTGPDDERWQNSPTVGSTIGPFVDLSAPAVGMLIADPLDPNLPAGYGIIDGTSFAAPLAAGAAALAWSINPNLTADEVWEILRTTAVDLGEPGWDEVYGHGRLDIGAVAYQAALSAGIAPEPGAVAILVVGAGVAGMRRRRKAEG